MGIDFSRFSEEFKLKFEKAARDNKITSEEFNEFSKADQDMLRSIFKKEPEIFGNIDIYVSLYEKSDSSLSIKLGKEDETEGEIILGEKTKKKYKGASYGYLKDGLITLYDKDGNSIKDKNGNPVIFDYAEMVHSASEADEVDGNFEIAENESPDRTNRRFAVALVSSMYNGVISDLQSMVKQMGVLDVGFWRELFGMGVQKLADLKHNQELITATTEKKIERIAAERDNITKSLTALIDSPAEFESKFYQLVGKDYRNNAFQELRDIQHNIDEKDSVKKYKSCVSKFKELYPDNHISKNVENWQESAEFQEQLDEYANIAVMFIMTAGIGSLFKGSVQKVAKQILAAAAKGDKKAVMINFAKLTSETKTIWKSLKNKDFGIAAGQMTLPAVQASATMGTWEGCKAFINGATNGEKLTPQELLQRTYSSIKGGASMGLTMGVLEVTAIAPIMVKMTPFLNKLSGASAKVSQMMKSENGVVPMEKVMEIYTKTGETLRGKIVKDGAHAMVALPLYTAGFTVTDTAFSYDEDEFRQMLLNSATTDEEREAINKMSSMDLRIAFAREDFKNQVKGMMTVEGVGLMFRRLQAARIASQTFSKSRTTDILGANLREKTVEGKKVYELVSPENDVIKIKDGKKEITEFSSIEEAASAYSALCIRLYGETVLQTEKENSTQASVRIGNEETEISSEEILNEMDIYDTSKEVTEEIIQEKGLELESYEERSARLEVERQKRVSALDKMKFDENMSEECNSYDNRIHSLKVKNKSKLERLEKSIRKNSKLSSKEKEYLFTLVKNRINPPSFDNYKPEQIAAEVQHLVRHFNNAKYGIKIDTEKAGLTESGYISSRVKSDTSTYDKLFNYMKDNENATLIDALGDVRDEYGLRSVIDAGNYTDKPNVMIWTEAAKNPKLTPAERRACLIKACREAAIYQSEKLLLTLQDQMRKQAESPEGLKGIRMVNYVSHDGIPVFSETQLWELYRFAEELGIDKDHIKITEVSYEKNEKGELVPVTKDIFNKKVLSKDGYTTSSQKSGYTAFQMNFETKNGDKIEFQCRDKFTDEFGEAEHLIYDTLTDKDIIGRNPKIKMLCDQLLKVLDKANLDEGVCKKYREEYLKDYYTYCRAKSLGIDIGEPKLQEYAKRFGEELGIKDLKLDPRLDAKNLMALHDVIDSVKKGKIEPDEGMYIYQKCLMFSRNEGLVEEFNQFKAEFKKELSEYLSSNEISADESIFDVSQQDLIAKYDMFKYLKKDVKDSDLRSLLMQEVMTTITDKNISAKRKMYNYLKSSKIPVLDQTENAMNISLKVKPDAVHAAQMFMETIKTNEEFINVPFFESLIKNVSAEQIEQKMELYNLLQRNKMNAEDLYKIMEQSDKTYSPIKQIHNKIGMNFRDLPDTYRNYLFRNLPFAEVEASVINENLVQIIRLTDKGASYNDIVKLCNSLNAVPEIEKYDIFNSYESSMSPDAEKLRLVNEYKKSFVPKPF